MKNILIGICSFVLLGILILIIFTLHGTGVRKQELNHALTSSMQNAMERLQENSMYTSTSNEELVAVFQQEFLMQIQSNSHATIHILDVDAQKGLFSVEAILDFVHPMGLPGKVSARKTVIIEQIEADKEIENCTITYMVDGRCYKKYVLAPGTELLMPQAPEKDEKQFLGWKSVEGEEYVRLENAVVTEDCVFVAVFQ